MTAAGAMDRRLQVRRATLTDDGLQHAETWVDHGSPIWASRRDVRDSEKWAAGQTSATLMSRFVVRRSTFTEGVTPKDRFTCDGREWSVAGVKEVPGDRAFLEWTATVGSD